MNEPSTYENFASLDATSHAAVAGEAGEADQRALVDRSAPLMLLSIKPRWAAEILAGRKTIELRKFFTAKAQGQPLFLYATMPRQAIVGMAQIRTVVRDVPGRLWETFGKESAVPRNEFEAYFAKSSHGCAICLDNVRRLPELTLAQLREAVPGFRPPMSHSMLLASHPMAQILLDLAEARR